MEGARSVHSPLLGHVREYVMSRNGEGLALYVIAPYVRADALEAVLEGATSSVSVITTWRADDLASGASDLSLWPYCRERGHALYLNDRIHLKVFSAGMRGYLLSTGNVSERGMREGGSLEMGVVVDRASPADRMYLEGIRAGAALVTEADYAARRAWLDSLSPRAAPAAPPWPQPPRRDEFLTSALPMTRDVGDVLAGYEKIARGEEPSPDAETADCIYHDLANYGIGPGLRRAELESALARAFFAHPFVGRVDSMIDPEAYFGRVKEWVQRECTDVPVPSRRDLTGNVQVLYAWFERLGGGRYAIDVPGERSQRIRRVR